MANGKSMDQDPYVIRSGVRSGHKREFAFALKSQSELSLSRTRTRSGKPPPPPSSPSPPAGDSKRVKKSNAIDPPENGTTVDSGMERMNSPTMFMVSESKSTTIENSAPQEDILKSDGKAVPSQLETPMEVFENGAAEATAMAIVKTPIVIDSCQGLEIESNNCPKRFTRSALKSSAPPESEVETPMEAVENSGAEAVAMAIVETPMILDSCQGLEIESNKSPRRFTRSALKSSAAASPESKVETPMEVVEIGGAEAVAMAIVETPIVLDSCQGLEVESNKSPRRFTRSALKSSATPPPPPPPTESKADSATLDNSTTSVEATTRRRSSSSKVISRASEDSTLPPPMVTGKSVETTSIDVDDQQASKTESFPPHNSGSPTEALKVSVADDVGVSVETPIIVDDQQGSRMVNGVAEKPSRKLSRLAAKVLKENFSAIGNGDSNFLEKPSRRFTRSLLKPEANEDPAATGENSGTASGSVGSDESKGGASADDGSSNVMPSKKMELKMSKKIALNKLPTNVRELLGTGLLEGLPVMYSSAKQDRLEGVIKGNGILCSCNLCKGSKVVSAYNFELHADSTKKHPSDFILLGNGKSLHDILRVCTSVPLNMLESAIQNAVGPLPQSKISICQTCKELFHTPRTGKFGLLCDSCLLPRQKQQTTVCPSQRTPINAKLSGKVLAGYVSDGTPKNTSSQKKNTISTNVLLEDAPDMTSKNTSSQKKSVQGKITRKDLGLHKLVFMDDILPEGTEVGYYVCGKRLLEGFIKESGIYCRCCNTVISPSQFEAHAGRASRRKPYNNIYTSNGVSLHELSVSLSKDRKLSFNQNDDLCSICADGGDLLLCDLCPRVFHKECVGLSSVPKGDWYCRYCHDMHQREKYVGYNDNAIAAGRVAGVDPIEQIIKRCIRIVTTPNDFGVCVLCRCHDFSKSGFDQRTVMICDQCEKEYHVGCLKDHGMCDLKELPEGEWFCCDGCIDIHAALHKSLLHGSKTLQNLHMDIMRKKSEEKGLSKDAAEVRWRLLSGKTSSDDNKLLLSEAVSIFHESFDPIVDAATGRDLIPSMVYGRSVRDQDFGGMYCAVLTVNSLIVSAGILRVLGSDVAELPLVATTRDCQGQGYFQSLFSCIEKLLVTLKVKHFVLPAAEEAESIWTGKFGFSKITIDQLYEYTKGARPMIFHGTSLLHKLVPLPHQS